MLVSTWKVIGFCGFQIVETLVQAEDLATAKHLAKQALGIWWVLRTIEL